MDKSEDHQGNPASSNGIYLSVYEERPMPLMKYEVRSKKYELNDTRILYFSIHPSLTNIRYSVIN
jgi:hypothetical protein